MAKKNINYSCTDEERKRLDLLVTAGKKVHPNPTDKNVNRGTVITALVSAEIERLGIND